MALYNFDKSQKFSSLADTDFRSDNDKLDPIQSAYNHDNPDIENAERIALENIRISGAWVTVMTRTNDDKYDKTWNEDPDPTYFSGYDFKAYFAPPPPEITLGKFGHDAPNKLDLRFSRAEILNTLGERIIRIGDIIIIPHNSLVLKAQRFRVLHVQDSGNFRYRWMYLDVSVENLNADESLTPRIK